MTIEKMTSKAQESVRTAVNAAMRRGHPEVVPEHLVLAIVEQDGGIGGPLISKAGGDVPGLKAALSARLDKLPQVSGGSEPRLSARALTLLQSAEDEA